MDRTVGVGSGRWERLATTGRCGGAEIGSVEGVLQPGLNAIRHATNGPLYRHGPFTGLRVGWILHGKAPPISTCPDSIRMHGDMPDPPQSVAHPCLPLALVLREHSRCARPSTD